MTHHRALSRLRHSTWQGGRGYVFVISSPSGGGKTTVVERLQRARPGLVRSVSVTTRAPRRGERRGRDYHFVSEATFKRLRRLGALLEWARVHGAYYGTPREPVIKALARRRHVVLSIDVQGARKIRRAFGSQAVLVFLLPPSMKALRRRLAQRRTETPVVMRRRLEVAKRELACARWYDYPVVNNRLEHTLAEVGAIVSARQREAQGSCQPSAPSRTGGRRRAASTTKGVISSWRKWRSKNC